MRSYGLEKGRREFLPSIDEIIAEADRRLELGDGPGIRAWYESEADIRLATWQAKRDVPVTIGDVTLAPGTWCEPVVGGNYSWNRAKTKTWRNSVYLGQSDGFLYFERWGATAATDQWATGKNDSVPIKRIVSVGLIVPDARILAKYGEQHGVIAEMNAMVDQ